MVPNGYLEKNIYSMGLLPAAMVIIKIRKVVPGYPVWRKLFRHGR